MRRRHLRPAITVALTCALIMALPHPAQAAAPRPVYAPADGVADPGLVRTGNDFYAFATGTRAPRHRGEISTGPWRDRGPAMQRVGAWADSGGVWAPDAVHTDAGWVLYYSAPAKGKNGQRCIGAAVSATVDGDYVPSDEALICPGGVHGADDPVAGRPVRDAGVIDPSPFQASDGNRYVLYKTQQTPSSLRMFRVNANGTGGIGNESGELTRNSGIIENPVMVQRGDRFVLFASRFGYNNCSYATVWMRSSTRWGFANAAEHTLMTTSSTGICGPGGADIVPALESGHRIFLHGWVCGTGVTPCRPGDAPFPSPHRRVLYAAILNWGADGATPTLGAFLEP